jgi:3-isopropylmalate dehydrogenase
MAQASHGSAPDIAGRDIANPFSLVLSAALLLAWHGRRKYGVAASVAAGEVTRDIGGALGTQATGAALALRLKAS